MRIYKDQMLQNPALTSLFLASSKFRVLQSLVTEPPLVVYLLLKLIFCLKIALLEQQFL
jgi:hypothetical protein